MAKISLKSLIEKDGFGSILKQLIHQSATSICIKDISGKILFGNEIADNKFNYPVIAGGEEIGRISGDEKSVEFAGLLNYLVQKEVEKKKLGTEVLHLYKEINIIFNFSEKLARTIDAPSICTITLDEARQVINSDNGVVILWDESKISLVVVASSGGEFFEQDLINNEKDVIQKIILNGQSEIITDTTALTQAGIISSEITSLIFSALKVNDRVMGAIILACNELIPYTAAHLKLLTTLALQSSAAIESALLYEKNIKESKEREEAMRLVYEATGKFVPFEFIKSLGHNVIT
ncbi:MAG: GAF domain-containing protein, partial [Bacteroidota bacterium]|nr:GAF domain-containing protein [Bacteroidota bacterium]